MASTDTGFVAPIPDIYDTSRVPLIFEVSAEDMARRVTRRVPAEILETAGVVTGLPTIAFRSLDQRADLPADVSRCLPRHLARFAPAARCVLRDGGGRAGGDLNILFGPEIFDIPGGLGLTDLVTSRGSPIPRTARYRKPQRHASYLFVSPEWPAAGFDAPAGPEVSDHRPRILDIRRTSGGGPAGEM